MTIPISNMTVTWNNGATVFSAVKINVTNTASAAGSKILDLQIGGLRALTVDKSGTLGMMTGFTGGAGIFSIDICDIPGFFSGYGAGYGAQFLTCLASGGLNLAGASAVMKSTAFTVATLPGAAGVGAGSRSFVTDALAPGFGAAVVGGGAVKSPVYSDGAIWLVG